MTALVISHPRRAAKNHQEQQRKRESDERIKEVFAAKRASERAVEQAMRDWCEEFPGLVWEEFCRDGGLI